MYILNTLLNISFNMCTNLYNEFTIYTNRVIFNMLFFSFVLFDLLQSKSFDRVNNRYEAQQRRSVNLRHHVHFAIFLEYLSNLPLPLVLLILTLSPSPTHTHTHAQWSDCFAKLSLSQTGCTAVDLLKPFLFLLYS